MPATTDAACSLIDGVDAPPTEAIGTFAVTNPATGAAVATVAEASDACVARAVASSAAAFASWRDSSYRARDRLLREWRAALEAEAEALARLLVLETGKPLPEARGELAVAFSFLEWNTCAAARAAGSAAAHPTPTTTTLVSRVPVGVCLLVTAWNFPAAMLLRKVAMALAAGCAVLVKPSDLAPLTTVALARSAARVMASISAAAAAGGANPADLPRPGLFNVVCTTRAAHVVNTILAARPVRLLSFTGSPRTGRIVAAVAAKRSLRTLLELGGHAPALVFADADIDAAAQMIVTNKLRNAGQACVAVNRLFVQRGETHDALLAAVVKLMQQVTLGNGMDEGVQMGPMINEASVQRVHSHVEDAVKRGAKIATGGETMRAGSNFYLPTVLTAVTDDMVVAKEESFGPVLPFLAFDSEEEAVARANDNTESGLAAYVFTKDLPRAMRTTRNLEFAMIGVNSVDITTPATPFGGMRESGIGREGGADSLDAFCEDKYTLLQF